MPSFPWTKSELTNRLRIAPDWWVDSILVFESREVYARSVTRHGEQLRIIGYELTDGVSKDVDELIDPREVKRVIH